MKNSLEAKFKGYSKQSYKYKKKMQQRWIK